MSCSSIDPLSPSLSCWGKFLPRSSSPPFPSLVRLFALVAIAFFIVVVAALFRVHSYLLTPTLFTASGSSFCAPLPAFGPTGPVDRWPAMGSKLLWFGFTIYMGQFGLPPIVLSSSPLRCRQWRRRRRSSRRSRVRIRRSLLPAPTRKLAVLAPPGLGSSSSLYLRPSVRGFVPFLPCIDRNTALCRNVFVPRPQLAADS